MKESVTFFTDAPIHHYWLHGVLYDWNSYWSFGPLCFELLW